MPWQRETMKDVATCDKLREAGSKLWSEDFRMGQPTPMRVGVLRRYVGGKYPGNWNILVPGGKENKSDSLSSGERKGNSPNPLCFLVKARRGSVVGYLSKIISWESYKFSLLLKHLERCAIEGDSPVDKINWTLLGIPDYCGTRETLQETAWTTRQG